MTKWLAPACWAVGSLLIVGASGHGSAALAQGAAAGYSSSAPGYLVELRVGPPGPGRPALAPTADAVDTPAIYAPIEFVYDNVPAAMRPAVEKAGSIWSTRLASTHAITVRLRGRSLEPGLLGEAGPAEVWIDRDADTATVIALAEANGSAGPRDGNFEIEAYVNLDVDWYLGTDGAVPSGQHDLVTVMAHEIAHGLGFLGGARWYDQDSAQFVPWVLTFDEFVTNSSGGRLVDLTDEGDLATALTSPMYFDGPAAVAEYGGRVPLFSPFFFIGGSSIYHLSPTWFPADGPQALMLPSLGSGRSHHDPGSVTEAIMADMGWSLPELGDPTPPSNTTIEVNDHVLTVRWAPPSTNAAAVSGYKIIVDTLVDEPTVINATGSPAVVDLSTSPGLSFVDVTVVAVGTRPVQVAGPRIRAVLGGTTSTSTSTTSTSTSTTSTSTSTTSTSTSTTSTSTSTTSTSTSTTTTSTSSTTTTSTSTTSTSSTSSTTTTSGPPANTSTTSAPAVLPAVVEPPASSATAALPRTGSTSLPAIAGVGMILFGIAHSTRRYLTR